MYLDKIEIHGFKSFGDAIVLSIPKGITGVIGPNGSGKSNVADAIRWVLGEQSAKSLRGSKMEDIIFAGTENRKSLGYAEVAMCIKNPDHEVPIDYQDIVIKRRVYRSGESEYFINGSLCRLKDIQELFMDTGVGKEGYSIIGQGQIDRVLSSKPEERRTLFEEAAGIYKYKVRRLEAEKKLDKQRENLTRINDILLEIASRLEPLATEAQKTKEFLQLKEELKQIEVNLFIYEIDRLEKELLKLSEDLLSIEVQINTLNADREQLGEKSKLYKKQKNDLFNDMEMLVHTIAQLEKEQQKKHSQIEITHEKIVNIDKLLEQIENDKKNRQSDNKNKTEKLSLLQSKKLALEIEKVSREEVIIAEAENLKTMTKDLESLESTMDVSRKDLYEKMREVDLLKTQIYAQDELETQLDYRILQMTDTISNLNSDIQHQEVNIKVLEKNKEEIKLRLSQDENYLKQIDQNKTKLQKLKAEKEQTLRMSEQAYRETDRQLKWLEQIKVDHEGYYSSVKQVLKVAHADKEKWKGIVGVVGELLEVPKEYETALVTALGSSIQHIVTITEEYAKDMINLMKQKGISRVTFLPKDTITAATPVKDQAIFNEAGVLGTASSLVTYDSSYSHIISSLLGRIIIVDTMKNASLIARKYNYKYKLVTIDGEVFNAGGSLSGGSSKNQSNNMFSRNREIKELGQKVQFLNKQMHQLNQEIEGIDEELKAILVEWDKAQNNIIHFEEKQKENILELDKAQQALKFNKNTQLQLITEKNAIEDSIEETKGLKQTLKNQLELLGEHITNNQDAMETLETDLLCSKKEKENAERELNDKKIDLSAVIQNMFHVNEQIKEIQDVLENMDEKYAMVEQTIKSYLEEKVKLSEDNKSIKQEIVALEEKIIEYNMKRSDYDTRKLELEVNETEIEEQMAKALEDLDQLKEEKHRLENKKQSTELQKQGWGSSMWEQYEMTYTHALSYKKDLGSISELRKRSSEIKAKVKSIGHVNVNAVEEYNETKTRYEFLSVQKQDIERAEKTLLEMIQDLTQKMQIIFNDQFKKIAVNFTHVFKELFGGGEAYLQLTDESDILESGIEIIAKPPGKKLQNMTLLSGGERTLTAISLLFGILKLKPSPFCVLDEIESALDDANVLRFAEYLYKLADETQFIVITHRKGTMERAHTLYGVTMQERGVSTVLSIKLEEAKGYLEEKKTS